MPLSAPPEQTLREPLGRPVEPPSRRLGRIAGIFMVLTFNGRHTGVDGPLIPVLPVPVAAAS